MVRAVVPDPNISFEYEPPSRVCQGDPFSVIVNVNFPKSEEIRQDTSYALNISLGDGQGHNYGKGLGGSLTTSLEIVGAGSCQRRAVFKDIVIRKVGRHQLQILLAVASTSKVTIKARLDSDFVEVQAA